ncbi:MAG: MaoC family dehydratase N-terminal domain-containing protein [Clostridia bacterium]|nr:MaoC family dehydratase N-terminal domain-containing protein [Deltaproteobacteria bacterium]
MRLTPQHIAAYIDATGDVACGDFAPPMMAVAMSIQGALPLLKRSDIIGDPARLAYMVHAEEQITWFSPLRAGDELSVAADLLARDQRASGEAIIVATQVKNQRRERIAQTRSTLLIRNPKPASLRALRAETTRRVTPPQPTFSMQWQVDPDQAERYANASGDHNPVHLDNDAARKVGLKGRILHGMCTMAFAQRTVITKLCDSDSTRLKSLQARFVKPVFPGDILTCFGWPKEAAGQFGFEVRNQCGLVVVRDGEAQVQIESSFEFLRDGNVEIRT